MEKLPIAELGDQTTAERLLQSLQKGNLQSVNFVENGQLQQHFLAANPRFKSIDVYDMNLNKLYHNQQQAKEQTNSQASSLENKTPRPRVKKSGPTMS